MTNNTTAALTDEQRIAIQECIDYLKPAGKEFDDLGFGESKHTRCIRTLRALLTSPRAAVPAPDGWKLVPIEPTQDMLDCWWDGLPKGTAFLDCTPRGAYGAMLDAAPAAPVAEAKSAENAELASMTRMFHAACADLGLINEALGLDPDDGGAEPILDAIQKLKEERDQWADAGYAAQAVAADGAATDYERLLAAVGTAYGYLWHINEMTEAPIPHYSPAKAAYASRRVLREFLTPEQRGIAINEVGREIGRFIDDAERAAVSPATADERAAFVDAYLRMFPAESLESAPRAARGIAESIASNNGSAFKLWQDGAAFARASQAAAPAEAREPIYQLQQVNGAWLDVPEATYVAIGRRAMRVVYSAPADAGEAVAPAGSLVPTERGIYAWIAEGSSALVLVHTRPTAHSPGGVMNASLLRSCEFYNGCPVDQWSGGTWYGPFKHVYAQGAQGGKGGEA